MSIRYLTTCDNCKTPYSFETGLAYLLFRNDSFHKSSISSLGNKQYRLKLKEYLNENKDFCSPIESRLYGCKKCNFVYNIDILESFNPDFEFHCKKCKETLIKISMDTFTRKDNLYLKFYDSTNSKFKCLCQNCKKELSGLVDCVMNID